MVNSRPLPLSAPLPRARLWAEFLGFFVGVPLVLAFALPPTAMFTVLGLMTVVGLVLLHRTPFFAWSQLAQGRVPWLFLLGFGAVTGVFAVGAVLVLFPHMLFFLPQNAPAMWGTILLAYPLVSALPQELIFRPLFFRRYGALFPDMRVALAVNAVVFALAHLMYAHPLVLAMTLAGGWVFGWLYAVRGSFAAAVIAHGLAGAMIFTSGLGILFYSGAVR